MGTFVNCATIRSEILHEAFGTDICLINSVKWEATALSSILLFGLIIYMMLKWKYRCHKTLLTFHNLRAAITLLLLAINSIELAKALLPLPQHINDAITEEPGDGGGGDRKSNDQSGSQSNLPQPLAMGNEAEAIVVVIGSSILANAITAIIMTITLICYHRMVELKKSLEFLYVSSAMTVLIFILRIYELAEIVYYESIMELESIIEATSAVCLLFLAIIDGFTVYKERYRPDYLEDYDKIGYKHTLATFYSKACFWWLTPLLWFGYKEPLELEDLGQMRVEDSARAHYDRFLLIYKTAKVKHSDKPPSLWMCYLKNSWRMFTLGGLLKLLGDLFAVIGPLAIQQIVQYIEIMYGIHYDNILTGGGNTSTSTSSSSSSNATLLQTLNNDTVENHLDTWLLGNNIRRSIRSQQDNISIREMTSETASSPAIESIWLPNTNVTITESSAGNEFPNINTDVYNHMVNDDYNISTTATNWSLDSLSSPFSTLPYFATSFSTIPSGSEVKIYYASWSDLLANGWCIAWLVLLAALAQGALSQASTHILNMTGIRIKTSLQGLIYRKTLLLNTTCLASKDLEGASATFGHSMNSKREGNQEDNAAKQHGVNSNVCSNIDSGPDNHHIEIADEMVEHKQDSNVSHNEGYRVDDITRQDNSNTGPPIDNSLNDIGAITNLMSEDTLNIMSFFWIAHYVWAIPLKFDGFHVEVAGGDDKIACQAWQIVNDW
ncbi:uncharacterized protein LOC142224454 [Haematobia irritans]|uniref:uncharacterized protein LOC142224454 n=1 Tax=Haematobia irritans TaxID=7368 RepID=UPI003F4F634B